jgi:RNA polymerase sigma-70 factor (ECF subfamily)
MDTPTDEDLMLRVQEAGDRQAFTELFRRYRVRITSYLYRLLRDPGDAESLAQETFLRVLQRGHLYTYPRRFSTWVFTVARNLAADFLKKKRAITSESFDLMADAQSEPEHLRPDVATMHEEASRELQQAIDALPGQHREVLILRAFYDMSYREIAEIVGCPESTARSRMDYALKELKRRYRKYGKEKKPDIS